MDTCNKLKSTFLAMNVNVACCVYIVYVLFIVYSRMVTHGWWGLMPTGIVLSHTADDGSLINFP